MNKIILVIQPDEIKYGILKQQLSELNYPDNEIIRYQSPEEAMQRSLSGIQIILFYVPNSNLNLLNELINYFNLIPVIVLTPVKDINYHLSLIKSGVQEVLTEDNLCTEKLYAAIHFAIERNSFYLQNTDEICGYEKHYENIPIPIWMVDNVTTRFLFANQAAVSKYGYSKEEFSKMTLMDIRPKEEQASFKQNYSNNNNKHFDFRYSRHIKKSGEIFYVHIFSQRMRFNNHDCRLAVAVDVNDKVLGEQQNTQLGQLIKEQKEQLENILVSIDDAIWSRRADTLELVYANKAYFNLYGFREEEINKNINLIVNSIYTDDLELFLRSVKKVRTEGAAEKVFRYNHSDGTLRIFKTQANLKKGKNGHPDMINGITIDITKEEELLKTIRNNEQKLTATINNTKDLIWSVNSRLELIFCNKPYQDFFYRRSGIMLKEGDYVLGNWHSDSFINKRIHDYERAFKGESFFTVIEETFEERKMYFEISSTPIKNHDGIIVAVNCISRDITEQRMQLLKIQQQNERLSEIAWIQSHRVRGPVASILGLIPLFSMDETESQQNSEVLDNLRIAAEELDVIIKEVVKSINNLEKN